MQAAVDPMMIRVYNGEHKGATAFFRNRPFLDAFFSALRAEQGRPIKILVHACSVGAEPYSLALWWLHRVVSSGAGATGIDIAATDIDPGFLAFARQATYPAGLAAGMSTEEAGWFDIRGEEMRVPAEAAQLVRFLEPMSFVDGDPGEQFDAVLVMNALTYVSVAEQSKTIDRLAACSPRVLALTAFHPDSIRDDLIRQGFVPSMENHRLIHESWGDRLSKLPVSPGSPDYSWRLPPYDESVPEFAYRFGSLFVKASLSDELRA